MSKVTGEEVKAAMIAAHIRRVDHHDCGGCHAMVYYYREGEQLFFNPQCDCTSGRYASPPELRSWDEAADWINMQRSEAIRMNLRVAFGLSAAPSK